MRIAGFRDRMMSGTPLAGTFMKTPAFQLIEVLAQSELDFVCLDAEHAPFDRAAVDACLAIGRALDFPVLVRVGDASPKETLWALDAGAVGIVVPHVDSPGKARAVAKAARFGHGGRGFAGSTRWAGYATRSMSEVLAQSHSETVVIVQIEDPAAVEAADAIAAVGGIDGLFLGPADLSVGYGLDHMGAPQLEAALQRVGEACRASGKTFVTFVPNAEKAAEWAKFGLTMFFIASEQTWMRAGATAQARGIHDLGSG